MKTLERTGSASGPKPSHDLLSVNSDSLGQTFTGERVIPGLVEPQLWNEHISRYHFAALFAAGKRVLDVGCGTGYGTDLLAERGILAVGFDRAPEAVQYASANYAKPSFLLGSADAFPVASKSFDLVTAFEVIEHISEWPNLIEEAARVIDEDGVFVVSTPNKNYYAETREEVGPNPFHVHEFELKEFESALTRYFPFVRILAQNQQEAIVFAGNQGTPDAGAFVPPVPDFSGSHFFVAVCGMRAIQVPAFTHVSSSSNLLRERESHIRALIEEVEDTHKQHLTLCELHRVSLEELDEKNRWALQLDAELKHTVALLAESKRQTEALLRERELVKSSFWLRFGRAIGVGPWSDRRARIKVRLQVLQHWLRQTARFIGGSVPYLLGPLLLTICAVALLAEDLCFALFGRRRSEPDVAPRHSAASVIIPNWNGRDLLEKFLPSMLDALEGSADHEVIVVDNASTDTSVSFLQEHHPQVKILQLSENEGFSGACNRGAVEAKNDVVVMLNNDMRVERDFLSPLLEKFSDPQVFAVSSQIFFSDPKKVREETGLTETWWENGHLGVGHRIDPAIQTAYPCAYPGGGSSAFDRSKFLQLGGFDKLFHPFYYEDTDLGRLAWKRGWKILYEPTSIVYHEHRGTIGRKFPNSYIDGVLRKNAMLYCWKNIHDWRMLGSHFWHHIVDNLRATPISNVTVRCDSADARHTFRQLGQAMVSRWRALSQKRVSDLEAFRRPLGGYYRDRFIAPVSPVPDRLNILLLSPYPIEPPVHGGAVFMREAVFGIASRSDLHLISFVDTKEQLPLQESLRSVCKTCQFIVRPHVPLTNQWTLLPNAIREFGIRDFAWAVHRTMYLQQIDVLQLEYTILGQYAGDYKQIPCILFEHDISSQSLWRRIKAGERDGDILLEYIRMRLYEPHLLKSVSRVQVCSSENARDIVKLVPKLKDRVDHDVRASIDVSRYNFCLGPRQPDTLLFIGSFRHSPNLDALRWFTEKVFPSVLARRPHAQLIIVGSDPPQSSTIWNEHPNIRVLGTVPDVRIPLQTYSVFVCPVLSGSGVRVKLLEAFASGIPAISTSVGAEGLASKTGVVCEIADTPEEFAASVLKILENTDYGTSMAQRARAMMDQERDSRRAMDRLESAYRKEVSRMRDSLTEPAASARTKLQQA